MNYNDLLQSETSLTNILELVQELIIRIGKIDQDIKVRVYRNVKSGNFICEASHNIRTPAQSDSYTSDGIAETLESAIKTCINGLTSYFDEAVKANHKPEASWLIANTSF